MNVDTTYDYIIYSAGVAGVITALDLTAKGKSVLLLNFYGFMGGSITESLNCHQVIDEKIMDGSIKNLFDKIKKSKHGILYHSENEFIFNPEMVKIVLQEEIENSKIDLLFHIVPFYLKQKDQFVELSLTGKEGIFNIKGKTIIDASDEYDLIKLTNSDRILIQLFTNMFLTGSKDDTWQNYSLIANKIKLNDNRYWISLKLPRPDSEFFVENASQIILNDFEEVVQKSGGRVQLIAPQSQKIYAIEKRKISENIFHVNSLLKENLNYKNIITKSSELELNLNLIA